MIRKITSGEWKNAKVAQIQFLNGLDLKVSYNSVKNASNKAGFKVRKKVKIPLLTPRHRHARLNFARKYESWTVEDWKSVIFSDKSKINRCESDGIEYVWKKTHSAPMSHHIEPTIKHNGNSLMVWSCIIYHGVGYLCRIDGGLDAQLYRSILEEEFLNTIEFYGLNENDIILQHDDDPKHTSKKPKKWLLDNNIRLLDWLAQSPDLNPIEYVGFHLKQRLNGYEHQPPSIKELWSRVEKEWESIPTQLCHQLIESCL